MRDEQVPHHRLKCFRVRRDMVRVHSGNDDAGGGFLCRVTAVATDNADDGGTGRLGELNRADKVRADILFHVAAANRENEQAVLGAEAAAFQPLAEDGGPAFVVGAGGEFGDVVGGRVGFEVADFAEVIHGM